ncbi:hypothetical protein C1645_809430 [Glomus cerebriforme]|uniref:TLDc domain-containing protein n=1 Tax=Glomus cerebriforme TaxID=658196 RepID=A0A397S9E6_9GLOM|nr:hypothetical protein C1645_809430 [Glomus cerebriforme]
MDDKLLSKLSQNLLEILDDDEYYDITIEVGNDPYVKVFRAHMVILNYRSPYLRRILIITFQHAELISKWIDKLEIKDKLTTSYEFKLLYRYDSQYNLEFKFDKIREICKNQSHTVVIIKVQGNNEILGGYNPIKWKFDGYYGITKDSFIFSFSHDSIENYILSRVKDKNRAIYSDIYQLRFGASDLTLTIDSISSCDKYAYEKQIRKSNYGSSVKELEVFQIVQG